MCCPCRHHLPCTSHSGSSAAEGTPAARGESLISSSYLHTSIPSSHTQRRMLHQLLPPPYLNPLLTHAEEKASSAPPTSLPQSPPHTRRGESFVSSSHLPTSIPSSHTQRRKLRQLLPPPYLNPLLTHAEEKALSAPPTSLPQSPPHTRRGESFVSSSHLPTSIPSSHMQRRMLRQLLPPPYLNPLLTHAEEKASSAPPTSLPQSPPPTRRGESFVSSSHLPTSIPSSHTQRRKLRQLLPPPYLNPLLTHAEEKASSAPPTSLPQSPPHTHRGESFVSSSHLPTSIPSSHTQRRKLRQLLPPPYLNPLLPHAEEKALSAPPTSLPQSPPHTCRGESFVSSSHLPTSIPSSHTQRRKLRQLLPPPYFNPLLTHAEEKASSAPPTSLPQSPSSHTQRRKLRQLLPPPYLNPLLTHAEENASSAPPTSLPQSPPHTRRGESFVSSSHLPTSIPSSHTQRRKLRQLLLPPYLLTSYE